MKISVLGAGAFGTSLAIALGQKGPVTLWARDPVHVDQMKSERQNSARLQDAPFPKALQLTADLAQACAGDVLLLGMPMQTLGRFLTQNSALLAQKKLVACCKGIDLETGTGAIELISHHVPSAHGAILTGPSFAKDIARGLPTALCLACADESTGKALQTALSTSALRIYRSADVSGAQIGGALKNVMAIACGAVMGAGLGESARAAIMTRGFAEMHRFATELGADPQTLVGLSGFGDLTLTCTSELSRNYKFGFALGAGQSFDPATTVEGAATSRAVLQLSLAQNIEMPITQSVAALVTGESTVAHEMEHLLSRPLKEE